MLTITMCTALKSAREQVSGYLSAHGYLPADDASDEELILLTDDLATRFFLDKSVSAASVRLAPNVRAAYVFGLAVGLQLRYLHGDSL
jgi:hypothetical protein